MEEDHYARTKGFPTRIGLAVLAVITTILWFAIGMDQQEERAEEARLLEERLPTIWLVYRDDVYKGEMIGYCWFGKCKDSNINDIKEFQYHIIIQSNTNAGFIVNSIIDNTNLDLVIYNAMVRSDGSIVAIDMLDKELEAIADNTYRIDLEQGNYLVIARATWDDNDYVEYAFSIRVV